VDNLGDKMKWYPSPHHCVSGAILSLLIQSPAAIAQITADPSLATSVNTTDNRNFTIVDGIRSGNNLFHSFSDFSISTGGSAVFASPPDIQTIFSRVTGNNISRLDGRLQVSGNSNLFLLNPNGILFGPNAQIQMAGAFLGTTATAINFADGHAFNQTTTTPLLSISTPIGLQMGQQSGGITVQGAGNQELVPTNNLGLVTPPGQSFSLVGNSITVDGGVITAPAGRLAIGSVAEGQVKLTATPIGWQLDYSGIQNFADINLIGQSSLWNPYPVSNPLGGIDVVGRNITLDRAQIGVGTIGQSAAAINIQAQNKLQLITYDPTINAPTNWITSLVTPGATGDGGGINIKAAAIELDNGGRIGSLTSSTGKAGDVNILTQSLKMSGVGQYRSAFTGGDFNVTSIESATFATGNGGNITVNTEDITIQAGAQLVSFIAPTATGNGGNILINSRTVFAQDISDKTFSSSGIQALATGTGQGGNVEVLADRIQLLNGGTINTFIYRLPDMPNSATGNAGSLKVSAKEWIEISGASPISASQTAFLGSATTGAGKSGDVTVRTPQLMIKDGASLSTGTAAVISIFGSPTGSDRLGDGGNLQVVVDRLEVSGINSAINNGSSLGTFTFGNGNAGNVNIQAREIKVLDGGNLVATTLATGNSGELKIQADDIYISGERSGRIAAILSRAEQFDPLAREAFGLPNRPTGNTARLIIDAQSIVLDNQGQISSSHKGIGNAGDLEIRTNSLTLDRRAEINANTLTGNGGDVDLQVAQVLLLKNNSRISVESSGVGNGGNIRLNSNLIVGFNNSDIIANAIQGNGGNIQLSAQGLIGIKPRPALTPDNDITASSQRGISGTIVVNTPNLTPTAGLVELDTTLLDRSNQVSNRCQSTDGSAFIMTGRGGTPEDPAQSQLTPYKPWQDTRSIAIQPPISARSLPPQAQLIEATSWKAITQGKVELIAQPLPSQKPSPFLTCATS
jgi:filamentous hemagglutinin family protein